MQILKVKAQEKGFLVNDYLNIPKDNFNSDYLAVQKWLANGGVVEPEFSLAEIKTKKITEIKSIRDSKNVEPIVDTQALIIDNEGNITEETSYFIFHTDRHQINPAADPSTILITTVLLDQTLPYSTKTPDGEKITIALTPRIAGSLAAHLAQRNNANYMLSDKIEAAVNAAISQEEVETITWDVKYLE